MAVQPPNTPSRLLRGNYTTPLKPHKLRNPHRQLINKEQQIHMISSIIFRIMHPIHQAYKLPQKYTRNQ